MANFQGVLFEPRYGMAVCTVHGTAIHPEEDALKKHLRGRGHFCKGRALKEAVGAILGLELRPLDELLADPQPAVWGAAGREGAAPGCGGRLELQALRRQAPHYEQGAG